VSRDLINIRHLPLVATIGCHPWERDIRQELRLDLELAVDAAHAAASDDLDDALDYQAVADAMTAIAAGSEFKLIETLAEILARQLIEQFGVCWLRLRLSKPGALPGPTEVSIQIERQAPPPSA